MRVLALLPETVHDNFTFNNSIELGILQWYLTKQLYFRRREK